jgi:signal transduction histidine kinase
MSIRDYISRLGKNTPIRKKLLLMVFTTMSMALLLASVAVVVFDRQSAKHTMQQEINVLTRVIAHRSTAALTFGDRQLAMENLRTLAEKETIVSACIYDNYGTLFAEYIDDSTARYSCAETPDKSQQGYLGQYFNVQYDIKLDDAVIGSIHIRASLHDINRRLVQYIYTVALIFLAVGALVFMLAIKLQKIITRPIDELAQASRIISRGRDYSIRVKQTTNDEVGQLMAAFNVMLDGIEQRDAALVDAKENLEEMVRGRTRELREAQNELLRSERMATLGQLTATVSHELRNPLGTIRTSVFTLANKLRDREPGLAKNIERIERNIIRCDNIITELLDFSRIRALQHEKTNLRRWIGSVIEDMDVPESINVRLELDDNIDVEIDRDLLRRVIVNLVDNACHALQEVAEEGSDSTIIIQSALNNSRTEIIVIDTGPGIPEEVLPHIFEPLYSTKSFGVGLGLPVVKQIMEQHGGGVEVASEKNVGTRVVLWLPASLNISNQIAS